MGQIHPFSLNELLESLDHSAVSPDAHRTCHKSGIVVCWGNKQHCSGLVASTRYVSQIYLTYALAPLVVLYI